MATKNMIILKDNHWHDIIDAYAESNPNDEPLVLAGMITLLQNRSGTDVFLSSGTELPINDRKTLILCGGNNSAKFSTDADSPNLYIRSTLPAGMTAIAIEQTPAED